jgi:hypothetical protein
MPSLSSYDKGKRAFEGRRYRADIEAAQAGMRSLLGPMREHNLQQRRNKKGIYRPRMVLTLGNHEDRINRAINDEPMLDGTISTDDLNYPSFGWEVYPFLEVVVIEGVAFSHFFSGGALGRPIGSAQALLNKKHMSCVAGHQQGRQVAYGYRADGKKITGIIAGSMYTHDEGYMNPQGNRSHWRGLVVLDNVRDGEFDDYFIPLETIIAKYST